MKRRFRISLLLGVIFIFSVAFVNADEVDSNEQDAVNDITTEQNIEAQVEQDNHGNGIQTSNPKMEAKANNNTDVQAPRLVPEENLDTTHGLMKMGIVTM